MPIVADAFGGAEGLLGTDGMRDKRIFIDFRNDFITIRACATGARPRVSRPCRSADDLNPLIVAATIGNLPVRAIIDTGAQASVGNVALQTALRRQIQRNSRAGPGDGCHRRRAGGHWRSASFADHDRRSFDPRRACHLRRHAHLRALGHV
ncbi:MAG: hypothetical protein IPM70_10590 [Proteobacteria bacterium]|nr:hypothetical protein [Pseudomonadota bacterium]